MSIDPIDESLLCPLSWEKFSPVGLNEELIEYYYRKYAPAPSSDSDYNPEVISPDNNQNGTTMIEAIDISYRHSLRQVFSSVGYCNKKRIGDDQDFLSKLLLSKNSQFSNQFARAP